MRQAITEKEARALGMGRLTTPYVLPREEWMLRRVLEDMIHGNIEHAVVAVTGGVEVWRTNIVRDR